MTEEHAAHHQASPDAFIGPHDHTTAPVVIDCDSCLVRSPGACGDCVVTVLLGGPPAGVELDSDELTAIENLAESGLVPPLRLVTSVTAPDIPSE